jgi:hypothetical protein
MIEYVKNLWKDSGIRDMRPIPRQEGVYVMMGDHRDMKGIDARGSRQNRFSQNLFLSRTGNTLIPGSQCLRFFAELSQKPASHNRS